MLESMLNDFVLPVVVGVVTHFGIKTVSWVLQACKEKFARDMNEEMEKQKEKKNKKRKK